MSKLPIVLAAMPLVVSSMLACHDATAPRSTCDPHHGEVTTVSQRPPYLWVSGYFERRVTKNGMTVGYCQQHDCGFDGQIGKMTDVEAIARCEEIARDFIDPAKA